MFDILCYIVGVVVCGLIIVGGLGEVLILLMLVNVEVVVKDIGYIIE